MHNPLDSYYLVEGSGRGGGERGHVPPTCEGFFLGARCSSVVRAFAHGAMGPRIDPSWDGPIELFLVPSSDPRLV